MLDGVTYKVNSDYSLASAQADVTGSAFTEVTDTTGIAAGAIASGAIVEAALSQQQHDGHGKAGG